jgi:hypothetical protein
MKNITKLLLIAALLFTNSCISRQVKKDPSYKETFRNYFISKRAQEVVFIGKKYHYVFQDESKQIANLINPEWRDKLQISEIKLRVSKDNEVYGHVNLKFVQLTKEMSKEDELLLKKQQFVKNSRNIFSKKISLKGVRYKPAIGFSNNSGSYFSKKYKSKIFYDVDDLDKVKKVALTPIAFAADGLLILAGGIWVPLLIIAFTDENTPEKFLDKFNR